eukprot:1997431-Amphidinium_carterae.1
MLTRLLVTVVEAALTRSMQQKAGAIEERLKGMVDVKGLKATSAHQVKSHTVRSEAGHART